MRALLLVGHGGVPRNMPRDWVREMKRLTRQGEQGDAASEAAAQELEARIRAFPRTDETDPYGAGIRGLAERLRARLPDWRVSVAYNEFCAPTIEEAIAEAVAAGASEIRVVTTMITPGGSHSETDIPVALDRARRAHPDAAIHFVWPLDLDRLAEMFADHLGA